MSVSFSCVGGAIEAPLREHRVGRADAGDRDERQADVAHPLEQAVQGSLVGDQAMDDGGAVALLGEAQPVEPGSPSAIEVPREAELVEPPWWRSPSMRVVPLICSFRGRCDRVA